MLVALTAALAAADSAGARPAHAQGASDEAAAVALFQEGQKLAAAGDYAGACEKFVEVKRTVPSAGLMLNLGDCLEKQGKMASAWAAFNEAETKARSTNDVDWQQEAGKRAKAIEAQVGRLVINVGGADRLPGLSIKRDGAEVGEGQWSTAVPADAGEHLVEVSAPGYRSWSTKVTVEAGARRRPWRCRG